MVNVNAKFATFLLCMAFFASVLVIGGCKGEDKSGDVKVKVDLTTPPALPEEAGDVEKEEPPAPPSPDGGQSVPGQQPAGLPLLG
ncbi:hypothetical protein HYV85_00415 [Candidatus Woesearchaeota archaeon]|nr:hypothetical protein [Candidatus Woesearchaeota archaeon]